MQGCERCHDVGYVLGTSGELGAAAVCACQGDCKRCRGRGVSFVVRDGYEIAVPCECAGLRARVRTFSAAGIPAKYTDKTLENFEAGTRELAAVKDRALRYGRGFSAEGGRGLVLCGEPGTGKTHLMAALLGYLTLQCGVVARFIDFFHLTARLRATYDDRGDESEADLLEPLVEVPVLAIDELGKGRGTAWELSIVDQLITRRYNAGRVLLATSNYLPEAWLAAAQGQHTGAAGKERWNDSLEERIGRRAYSRLTETADIVAVRGVDYRQRGVTPSVSRPSTR